jgi:hypothetical protein
MAMQALYSFKMSEPVNSATQHNTSTLKNVVCLSVLFTVNGSDVSQPIMNDATVEEMLNHLITKCDNTMWTVGSHITKMLELKNH